MGFNYAAEKKKFETLWARLRREYRAAGMSDAAIQKMHDFDWEVFKQERIHRLHTQDLGIGIFDEPSAEQEDKSALMKKFLESVSRWDDYTTASRYGWIALRTSPSRKLQRKWGSLRELSVSNFNNSKIFSGNFEKRF